jgi:hypothetical protein
MIEAYSGKNWRARALPADRLFSGLLTVAI